MSNIHERRAFIKRGLAVGALFAVAPGEDSKGATGPETECKAKLSLADSLITYSDLLATIESAASQELQTKFNEAYQKFTTGYGLLYNLTKTLAEKICTPEFRAEAERLCALTKTGLTSADLGLTSPKSANSNLQVSAAINDQVGKFAECLPPGERKLTPQETEALNQVIRQVKDVKQLQCDSDALWKEVTAKRKELEAQTSEIRRLLRQAIGGLLTLDGQNSRTAEREAASEAARAFRGAITRLELLGSEFEGKAVSTSLTSVPKKLEALALLTLLLYGGLNAVERISKGTALFPGGSKNGSVSLNHAPRYAVSQDVTRFIPQVVTLLRQITCYNPSEKDARGCLEAIQLVPISGAIPKIVKVWLYWLGLGNVVEGVQPYTDSVVASMIQAALIYYYHRKCFKCIAQPPPPGQEAKPNLVALSSSLVQVRRELG